MDEQKAEILRSESATSGGEKSYARVVLNVPLRREFDYVVPHHLRGRVRAGVRVRVPFGPRTMIGVCVGLSTKTGVPESRLKSVYAVVDTEPLFDNDMLALTRWVSEYYFCSWGTTLDAAIPAGVRRGGKGKKETYVLLRVSTEELNEAIEALPSNALKQLAVLDYLSRMPQPVTAATIRHAVGCSLATLRALERQGMITLSEQDASILHDYPRSKKEPRYELTLDQVAAVRSICSALDKGEPKVFLLHGVTGSGKTEVYLRAMERVLRHGRQAIVLVPEIALTPQTVERFSSRFERVAVLHSHLTDTERLTEWRRIRRGEASVVIGARSAVFAPVRDLGLIVIDEEHENSFKQQDPAPRYHARQVAVERARQAGAVVVLGSATPSLETYYEAKRGEFEFLHLPQRIGGRPMPKVEVIDMTRQLFERRGFRTLSRRLEDAIRQTLARNEQVILFLNRRGYSTSLQCRRCGFVLQCEQCDISMTYHMDEDVAVCHYCDARVKPPDNCPECGQPGLKHRGIGTERAEKELRNVLPGVAIARMDSDTMRKRGSHRRTLDLFRKGEVQILLGTQMIAKGLDFPNVGLVGVISADTSLSIPDFRAAERTFQLLAQVAGRTGRGDQPGHVLIQSYQPNHYAVRCAAEHDYEGFVEQELSFRERCNYPPFCKITRILFSGKDVDRVQKQATEAGQALRRLNAPVEVLGPAPALIAQIRGNYRWHLLMKSATVPDAHGALNEMQRLLRSDNAVQINVDVEPTGLL